MTNDNEQIEGQTEGQGDFSAEGVGDFGEGAQFEGTLPGEQPPSGGGQATGSLSAELAGIDMTDPLADMKAGKKVPTVVTISGLELWKPEAEPGRVVIKVKAIPTSPDALAKLGEQTVWCDIANPADPAAAAKGKANLRAICKAAGKPMTADGKALEGGLPLDAIKGASAKCKASKGKSGDRIFLNF